MDQSTSYVVRGVTVIEQDTPIFNVPAHAIVNPVNLAGTMNTGIAAEVKQKYPDCFNLYKVHCRTNQLAIGQVLTYFISGVRFKRDKKPEIIIHFPVAFTASGGSDYGLLEEGMLALATCTANRMIHSIAIPALGCDGSGGLKPEKVKTMIFDIYCPKVTTYLRKLYLLGFNETSNGGKIC